MAAKLGSFALVGAGAQSDLLRYGGKRMRFAAARCKLGLARDIVRTIIILFAYIRADETASCLEVRVTDGALDRTLPSQEARRTPFCVEGAGP